MEMPLSTEAPVGYAMRARRLAVLGTDQPFEEAATVPEAYPGKTGWVVSDLVLHAKPSPLPSSINIGPVSACPNFPGLLFPYFPGMIIQDKISERAQGHRNLMLSGPARDAMWETLRVSFGKMKVEEVTKKRKEIWRKTQAQVGRRVKPLSRKILISVLNECMFRIFVEYVSVCSYFVAC